MLLTNSMSLHIIFIDIKHETAENSTSQGQDDVVHIPEGDVVKAKQGTNKSTGLSSWSALWMWLQRNGLTCHVCKWHKIRDATPLGNHPSNKPEEVTKTFRPVSRWSTLYFVDGARPRIRGEGSYRYVNLSGTGLNVHVTACVYVGKFKLTWVHILNLFPTPSTAFGPWSAKMPCHLLNGLQGNLTFWLLMVATNILRSFNQSLSKYLNRSGLTLLGLIASPFPSQARLGAIFTLPQLGWSDTSSTANTEPAQKQGSLNPQRFKQLQAALRSACSCYEPLQPWLLGRRSHSAVTMSSQNITWSIGNWDQAFVMTFEEFYRFFRNQLQNDPLVLFSHSPNVGPLVFCSRKSCSQRWSNAELVPPPQRC